MCFQKKILVLNREKVESFATRHPVRHAAGKESVKMAIMPVYLQMAEFMGDYVINAWHGNANELRI